eukprot:TRINITY_DN13027_c0_g1_i1.p2 TRINITY_DN13027_c0_g1~~TRINITY_DN13027_c0_g1_i1.p2  ORF type:complete len:144 (-),score=22.64 TRINITY_DN13027_c0_g1_i1:528-959(-)
MGQGRVYDYCSARCRDVISGKAVVQYAGGKKCVQCKVRSVSKESKTGEYCGRTCAKKGEMEKEEKAKPKSKKICAVPKCAKGTYDDNANYCGKTHAKEHEKDKFPADKTFVCGLPGCQGEKNELGKGKAFVQKIIRRITKNGR